MKTIERTEYLNRIKNLKDTPDIKVITGIRRSGKSILMQEYIQYLKDNFNDINVIFIDFMDLSFEHLKEYHALHAYVEERYVEGKSNYLFIDEVQMCPNFELAVNSLYSKKESMISISPVPTLFLLSADLATLFTGRYIEIHVYPFSFKEYCNYYDNNHDIEKLFEDYTIKGGLVGSYVYNTEKKTGRIISRKSMKQLLQETLYRSIPCQILRYYRRLSEFLMDNISNLTSPSRIKAICYPKRTYQLIMSPLENISSTCATPLFSMISSATISVARNILKAQKSSI